MQIYRYALDEAPPHVVSGKSVLPYANFSLYDVYTTSEGTSYVALKLQSSAEAGVRSLAVLYPDGDIQVLETPYASAFYPLWMPPTLEAGGQARVHVLNDDALSVRAYGVASGSSVRAMASAVGSVDAAWGLSGRAGIVMFPNAATSSVSPMGWE